jgi:hypothetical protein
MPFVTFLYFHSACTLNQSINVSCNSYLEHRASTTHRHRTMFFAATFTPFQFRPTALAYVWIDLLQVLFCRPLVFISFVVWSSLPPSVNVLTFQHPVLSAYQEKIPARNAIYAHAQDFAAGDELLLAILKAFIPLPLNKQRTIGFHVFLRIQCDSM